MGSADPRIGNRVKVFVTLKTGHKVSEGLGKNIRGHAIVRIIQYPI